MHPKALNSSGSVFQQPGAGRGTPVGHCFSLLGHFSKPLAVTSPQKMGLTDAGTFPSPHSSV